MELRAEFETRVTGPTRLLIKPAADAHTGVDLLRTALLDAGARRHDAADAIAELLGSLDSPDPNRFDVRLPFFVNVHAAGQQVTIRQISMAWGEYVNPDNRPTVINVRDTVIYDGDELAVRLQMRAGKDVPRQDFDHPFTIDALIDKPPGGMCTVSASVGFEWAKSLIGETTITTDGKDSGGNFFSQEVFLSDVMGV